MKIVYLIQAHKNSEQIKALISCLLHKNEHCCFVHIDKKNDALYIQLKQEYEHNPRVKIIDERVVVNWSGFSQVQATLQLMKNIMQSNITFNRIQLISGEDMPVKSSEYIVKYFNKYRDKEFIEYGDIDGYQWRIDRYNILTEYPHNRSFLIRAIQKIFRTIQKVLPERHHLDSFQLYRGSAWFNISQEAMEYILKYLDSNPNFIKGFRHSSCADEHFFQILLLNSTFKDRIVNNNLYYIEWKDEVSSPKYLNRKSIEATREMDNILFARKIDHNLSITLSREYLKQ